MHYLFIGLDPLQAIVTPPSASHLQHMAFKPSIHFPARTFRKAVDRWMLALRSRGGGPGGSGCDFRVDVGWRFFELVTGDIATSGAVSVVRLWWLGACGHEVNDVLFRHDLF